MSRPFRLSAVLSATVTAALTGALLSAPTAASATTYAAPKAAHVKACKKAEFAGAASMRLQGSTKAVGKSGKVKATARAWVYTNTRQQACIVTTATTPKVKKSRKRTDLFYSGSSWVENESSIKFEAGHQFNSKDAWSNSSSFFGGKPRSATNAVVVDLAEEGVMTAEDLQYFPGDLDSLKDQRYRMDVTSIRVNWQLTAQYTVKTKKVSKAKAANTRKAKYKKIDARRKAGLIQARATWQEWVAAQPQTTPEERVWVKEFGALIHDFEKSIVKGHASADRATAKQAAKDAVRGVKTVTPYEIKVALPLPVP